MEPSLYRGITLISMANKIKGGSKNPDFNHCIKDALTEMDRAV